MAIEEHVISKHLNGWDYQDSDRLFYREDCFYDYVVSLDAVEVVEEGSVRFSTTLLSGETCHLTLLFHSDSLFHLEFANQLGAFEMSSAEYLNTGSLPQCPAELEEGPDGFTVTCGELSITLASDPFQLTISRGGEVRFATSTKRVSRQFITPGLGQRIHADGRRESFLSWNIANGDAFFGLGEKFGRVEKSQSRVTVYAMDACGTNSTDLSYKAAPLLLSTAGYGMLFDTARRTHWDIGSFCFSSGSYLVESPVLRGYWYFGDDLKALITAQSELLGRPEMVAPWTLGVWFSRCAYMDWQDVDDVVAGLREREIPFDVINLDVRWGQNYWYEDFWVDCCDFEWSDERFPDPVSKLADLMDDGVACCAWLNPYLPPGTAVYAEGLERGYLVKTTAGGLAGIRRRKVSEIGLPDLTNPQAYEWWKGYVKRFMGLGLRAIKPDYTDRVPADAAFHNGFTGLDMHNAYIYLYSKACYEATQELYDTALIWKRPGFLGTGKFAGTWSGDVETSFEGLRFTLRGGLSIGFSGETLWSSDIAGFKGDRPSPELYIRWSQMGLLCSLARYHGTTVREPWYYGDEAVAAVRKYSDLRYRWLPYLMELSYESTLNGLPVMRHLAVEYPDDPIARQIDDQFLIGTDILVVPILEEGQQQRSLYLPAGRWIDIHTGQVREGNRQVTVPVSVADIPVYVREGAVIPEFAGALPHVKSFSPADMVLTSYGAPRAKSGWLVNDQAEAVRYSVGAEGAVASDAGVELVSFALRGDEQK